VHLVDQTESSVARTVPSAPGRRRAYSSVDLRFVGVEFFTGDRQEHVVKCRCADVEPGHRQIGVTERDQQIGAVLAGGLGGDADPLVGHYDCSVGEGVELAGDPRRLFPRRVAVFEFHVEHVTADLAFQPVRASVGDDLAVENHRESVAQLIRLFEVLRGQKDRRPEVVDAPEVVPQPVARLRIQPGRRLVQEDQRRSVNQRGRGVEAFLHAAGELFGALVCDVREIDEIEQFSDAVGPLATRHAVRLTGKFDVLLSGELRVDTRLLGHVPDGLADSPCVRTHVELVDAHLASGRRQKRRKHFDRRRLSRAVRPEEAEELALGDLHVDSLHGCRPVGVYEFETRRQVLAGGPFPGMGAGDPDIYKGFSWRFWRLARDGGHVGAVLPRGAFIAAGSEEFRRHVIENGTVEELTFLKNRGEWVFDGVGPRFTIGLLGFEKSPPADDETLPLRGPYPDEQSYTQGVNSDPYELSADSATEWTGSAGFPMLPADPRSVGVFQRLASEPPLNLNEPGEWRARPYRELDETNDKTKDDGTQLIHETDQPPQEDCWPVLDGGSLNPPDDPRWIMDNGTRFGWADSDLMTNYVQSARENSYVYAGSRSAFSEFDETWVNDPKTHPCLDYRVAFRDVTQRTNTRTVLASLVPSETFLTNTAPYFLWPRGDERDEAYLLGVLNSIPLDWYARRFVEAHVNYHILNSFPIPRPGRDDSLRQRVVELSGRLASQSEEYADWADAVGVDYGPLSDDAQMELIHELDAVVAHLYGLTPEHVEVIFETFHDNWDHESRLTAVLEWYDEWNERLTEEPAAAEE